MEKTITIEVPQEEAKKFSDELERLVEHMKVTEAESLERDARFTQMNAEFDQMIASIRRSLDNVEKYRSASLVNLHRQ